MTDVLSSFHEGAHATISFLLGSLPDVVTIRSDGDSAGHMEYLPGEAREIAKATVLAGTGADKAVLMRFLLSAAAGPAAQALKMRGKRVAFLDEDSWATFSGGRDYATAASVRQSAGALLTADLADIVSEAFDLLERPEIWAAVSNVAKDLERFGALDYEGIRDAVMYYDAFKTQTIVDRLNWR
jgi:hypothetical protein